MELAHGNELLATGGQRRLLVAQSARGAAREETGTWFIKLLAGI